MVGSIVVLTTLVVNSVALYLVIYFGCSGVVLHLYYFLSFSRYALSFSNLYFLYILIFLLNLFSRKIGSKIFINLCNFFY